MTKIEKTLYEMMKKRIKKTEENPEYCLTKECLKEENEIITYANKNNITSKKFNQLWNAAIRANANINPLLI